MPSQEKTSSSHPYAAITTLHGRTKDGHQLFLGWNHNPEGIRVHLPLFVFDHYTLEFSHVALGWTSNYVSGLDEGEEYVTKTTDFFVGKIIPLSDWDLVKRHDTPLVLSSNWQLFPFAHERHHESMLALVYVSQGRVLDFIVNQDRKLQEMSLLLFGKALQYMTDQNESLCASAVSKDGLALEFVADQTEYLCCLAVRQNGFALQFVDDQTHEQCMIAVKQNGMALGFVRQRTPDICLAAVKQNGMSLQFVPNQTLDLCLAAIHNDGSALQFVSKNLLCAEMFAVSLITCRVKGQMMSSKEVKETEFVVFINDDFTGLEFTIPPLHPVGTNLPGGLVVYTRNQVCKLTWNPAQRLALISVAATESVYIQPECDSCKVGFAQLKQIVSVSEWDAWKEENFCQLAVQQDGMRLRFVKNPTRVLCCQAVKQNGMALQFVTNQNDEICVIAITNNPKSFKYVKHPTMSLCREAIDCNPSVLEFIVHPPMHLCLKALHMDGLLLRLIDHPPLLLCTVAVRQNVCAVKYVPKFYKEVFDLVSKVHHSLAAEYMSRVRPIPNKVVVN